VAYGAVGAMDVCELGRSDSASAPALISRAHQGDQEAFAALFDLHKRHMYSLCLRMTGDIRKAEDVVRQAFVQVFRNLDTFPSEAVLASWLHRVVLDSLLRKLRRPSQASLEEPGASLEHSHGPCDCRNQDQERLGAVERSALARAVQDLPASCRTIFILHDIEGCEHREIARLLRCSVRNSKLQLHAARSKIREMLLANPKVALHGQVVDRADAEPVQIPPKSLPTTNCILVEAGMQRSHECVNQS
jgi:RNA polymerase sigma-70 factor (ECF subfamily)